MSYKIPWHRGPPPLRVIGVVGRTKARVWIQNREHTWKNANRGGFTSTVVADARLDLMRWPRGTWKIELWDTWKGGVVDTLEIRVDATGVLRVPLPAVKRDLTLRCESQERD